MPSLKRLIVFVLSLFFLSSSSLTAHALSCDPTDRDSLLSFYGSISSTVPLNWSSAADCCQWEGVGCRSYGAANARVYSLSLPDRGINGFISPSFIKNLTFLTHLNLSRNYLYGPVPETLVRQLQILDLSSNLLNGTGLVLQSAESNPISIRRLDLSSNHFYGSIDSSFLLLASNLTHLNVSTNSFSGSLPSSICAGSPLVEILDFSGNKFSGDIAPGFGACSRLTVFRGGSNSLSGFLPYDLHYVKTLTEISLTRNDFSGAINGSIVLLSNLRILELHFNKLTGELPPDIGLLSSLEQLQLHTNSLNGSLPHSLTDCSRLQTLLLRNNHFTGELSSLDFSKLQNLKAIDLGNNSFTGRIPESLCLCRSVTAIRLAFNRLVGEVPPCMASLKSLAHLSLSDNFLSNVAGALKILIRCENLEVLFLSRCFMNEMMPDDYDLLHLNGFQKLQIFTLGGCQLKGEIPYWISKLRKVHVLNLSINQISGTIPTWLGDMPSLFVLNLTQNLLSGELPREIGRLPALISDNSSSDLSYLALPFLFDSLQYNRLFNLPRGLKVGYNQLTGSIPEEIGQLKLLQLVDLNDNNFNGSIPAQLSNLVNLERLDLSRNHLSGEIPISLVGLNFLSAFSVANNDLQGMIPRGSQFDTFPATSFEGNPKLCGPVVQRNCLVRTQENDTQEEEHDSIWSNVPFGMGYFLSFFAVSITLVFYSSWRTVGEVDSSYVDTRTM